MTPHKHLLAIVIVVSGCGALPGRRVTHSPIPASWHWPCESEYRVATWHDDPIEFRLAVRGAVAQINAAAGRQILRMVGPVSGKYVPRTTVVRLARSVNPRRYHSGATPVYRAQGQCLDRWEVDVMPPHESITFGTVVDVIILHELLRVVGLEHIGNGVMAAVVDFAETPQISPLVRKITRCMADAYLEPKSVLSVAQGPFLMCANGDKGGQ